MELWKMVKTSPNTLHFYNIKYKLKKKTGGYKIQTFFDYTIVLFLLCFFLHFYNTNY